METRCLQFAVGESAVQSTASTRCGAAERVQDGERRGVVSGECAVIVDLSTHHRVAEPACPGDSRSDAGQQVGPGLAGSDL